MCLASVRLRRTRWPRPSYAPCRRPGAFPDIQPQGTFRNNEKRITKNETKRSADREVGHKEPHDGDASPHCGDRKSVGVGKECRSRWWADREKKKTTMCKWRG